MSDLRSALATGVLYTLIFFGVFAVVFYIAINI